MQFRLLFEYRDYEKEESQRSKRAAKQLSAGGEICPANPARNSLFIRWAKHFGFFAIPPSCRSLHLK